MNPATEPPHDKNVEKYLLGSIMLVSRVLDDIGTIVTPEDFYLSGNGRIFACALKMHNANKTIDAALIQDALKAEGALEDCGGEDFLLACLESVPHAAHAKYYAEIVAEKAQRRNLIFAGQRAIEAGHDQTREVADGVSSAESEICRVLERRAGNQTSSLKDILEEVFENLTSNTHASKIKTGFAMLDGLIGGLRASNLCIIAARPSIGKTAFAVNVARQIALDGNTPVGFVTLEQSRTEIAERLTAIESRMSMHTLQSSEVSEAQRHSVFEAMERLNALPLFIDDSQYRSIAAVEASARLMVRRNNIKILIVDYLQLIMGQQYRDAREQEVSEVSGRLKWLAKSLSIPVVALAQLNRQNEKRPDKRPMLSDLRESGAIEQDADVVILLHREEFYNPTDHPGEAVLSVAKNRNGPTGEIRLQFQADLMQFRDLAGAEHRNEPVRFRDDDSQDEWFR